MSERTAITFRACSTGPTFFLWQLEVLSCCMGAREKNSFEIVGICSRPQCFLAKRFQTTQQMSTDGQVEGVQEVGDVETVHRVP